MQYRTPMIDAPCILFYGTGMHVPSVFHSQVAMKFRLYSGLFHDLPYEHIRQAGITLPLFAQYCREALEAGKHPVDIVESFFTRRLEMDDEAARFDRMFAYLRLIERQVVLFDAVEDAAFNDLRDIEGPGSLHDILGRIKLSGKKAALGKLLESFGVRIVLTAHPTQFYTEHVLGIIAELREAIQGDNVAGVHRLLLQLGRTRFKKKEQPTPFDEAKAILWFMENVIYSVLPAVHGDLLQALLPDWNERIGNKPVLELGFWPGGDRDGNPNVHASTTRDVGKLLGNSIAGLYVDGLAELSRRLTFDGITEILERCKLELQNRLSSDGKAGYQNPEALLADLQLARSMLVERHDGLFVEELERFAMAVRCFGFHFASVDLRQDSRVIAKAMDVVFTTLSPKELGTQTAVHQAKGYDASRPFSSLEQADRLQALCALNEVFLTGKLHTMLAKVEDPVLRDCFEMFLSAREVQQRNGAAGIHRFVISNTQGPADVLSVRLLSILAGYTAADTGFDIVPLFETVDDLDSAEATMRTLYELPVYRSHLEQRGNDQHIMLGFSDGTKDGGYVTANWYIYRAKQALSLLSREAGIQVVFFDGRGGPPARGGGNTHKFYRSLGRDIESRCIHLTIQGQTISSMYGHTTSARYNLEQLLSAVLDNNLFDQNEDWHLDEQEARLIDELSGHAHTAYVALRKHGSFLDYLQEQSPLQWYAQANISSRPSKRPGSGALKLEDLRAIPFVGAWSQLKQNIPGYYGFGTAMKILDEAGRLDELRQLYRDSLYFRTLAENSMQSLSKVYLPLTSWQEKDPRFAELRSMIGAEVERSIHYLLAISGQDALLSEDPLNRASISLREELTLPASLIQQYAIARIRAQETASPAAQASLQKMIVKSMALCVNASRNSV